jgi:hypothetical protein
MTLLATAGSSQEAPKVLRKRSYMDEAGDLGPWVGELEQPDVHYLYRTNFNAVDVHNELAVGPRSVHDIGVNSLELKLWLSLLAFAETNAYCLYAKHHKLTSDRYCHEDFKQDLRAELLLRAHSDMQEEAQEAGGVSTRHQSNEAPCASSEAKRESMPMMFSGHQLQRDANKDRKCMVCGTKTKTLCGFGRAICGSAGGVTFWAWHLETVATSDTKDVPMQWQRGKRSI